MLRNKIYFLILLIFSMLTRSNNGSAELWVPISQSDLRQVQLLKAFDLQNSLLLAAEGNNLFISSDQGKAWERVMRFRQSEIKINDIKTSFIRPNQFYILTTEGLFLYDADQKQSKQLYQGIHKKNKNVLSLAYHPMNPDLLYIGTEQGLVISKDGGKNWSFAFAELGQAMISDLVVDEFNHELFLSTSQGVYRYHFIHDSFRLILNQTFSISEETGNEFIESDGDSEEQIVNQKIHLIVTDDKNYQLVAADKKWIVTSSDEGETWKSLARGGLDSSSVTGLIYSELLKTLLLSTEKSIYLFKGNEQRWQELYEGLPTKHIYSLAIQYGVNETLFVATQNGIFMRELVPENIRVEAAAFLGQSEILGNLQRTFLKEPSIREVQEAAIRYANVGNLKIKRWHYESRMRALLPSITFTKDLDISNNIHTDTGSTTAPDIFVQGPDERDKSTDFDLTWDLGDLIFNSSQTSIDSREKLMVELRDEILAEITRLYYERRRAQLDFLANTPTDPIESAKMQMRIDELTANLDALTDGFFSKRLRVM